MKLKILIIVMLSSILFASSDRSKKDEVEGDHSRITMPAEIFSLRAFGDKASSIEDTIERIKKYAYSVQQTIKRLQILKPAYALLEYPFERLSSFPLKEAEGFIRQLKSWNQLVELDSYNSLSKILPGQYCENVRDHFEFRFPKGDSGRYNCSFGLFWVNGFVRSSMIPKYTADFYDELIDKYFRFQNLKRMEYYRKDLLMRWQRVINDKISKALQVFFQSSAPVLYKAVENVSKHSTGRLAGVAFYFNEDTASMIAGRKALTKGDDKNHHIERVLIKRLLPDSEHNYGYLFVYTTLPPCNTDKIGCLGFYMQLAQHNPNLRTIVMFDHEYEDGSNYTSLTTANFTMVNRVKAAKAIEQAESRKSSIAKMALTLTRATSDQIVSALQKKDDETAVEILKKFEDSDSERGKRLSQKLLHKQVAAG